MEMFDHRTFDQHKTAGHYAYTLPDGSEVEQWESAGDSYLEVVRRRLTNYSTYRMYYFDTKRLMKKGEQFFNFPIGIWKTYDNAGVVTEEVDHERTFKISVTALEKIMARRSVDLSIRGNGVGVLREISPTPTYTVFLNEPGVASSIRFLVVDGTSGNIVSEVVKERTKD